MESGYSNLLEADYNGGNQLGEQLIIKKQVENALETGEFLEGGVDDQVITSESLLYMANVCNTTGTYQQSFASLHRKTRHCLFLHRKEEPWVSFSQRFQEFDPRQSRCTCHDMRKCCPATFAFLMSLVLDL